jgi:hypothetical protein
VLVQRDPGEPGELVVGYPVAGEHDGVARDDASLTVVDVLDFDSGHLALADNPAEADPIGLAQQAEDLGFDFVSTSDHPCGAEPTYEIWTMLSWIAAATSRIRIARGLWSQPAFTYAGKQFHPAGRS